MGTQSNLADYTFLEQPPSNDFLSNPETSLGDETPTVGNGGFVWNSNSFCEQFPATNLKMFSAVDEDGTFPFFREESGFPTLLPEPNLFPSDAAGVQQDNTHYAPQEDSTAGWSPNKLITSVPSLSSKMQKLYELVPQPARPAENNGKPAAGSRRMRAMPPETGKQLRRMFEQDPYPTSEIRKAWAAQFGLNVRQVNDFGKNLRKRHPLKRRVDGATTEESNR